MIINENGWGDKPQEVKESVKAKKIKQLNEDNAAETAGDENAEQK